MEITDAPQIPGAERLLNVPGVRNLRDVGGCGRVRTGLLFRSASLCELTPEGAEQLTALGLRTVVDLRSQPETEHWPNQPHGLTTVSLPTLPPFESTSGNPDSAADEGGSARTGLEGMYAFMADVAGEPIAAFVRRLLLPDTLPALVHCAVGKDRTGVTIAVLLSALGVSDADITADYLLSNHGLGFSEGPIFYLDENGVERQSHPVTEELLTLFLDRIRTRHGSAEAFLESHGLTPADLESLRALLLSPARV